MKITYAYDSKGKLNEINSRLVLPDSRTRAEEASLLASRVALFYEYENMLIDKSGFYLMIQPLYADDTVLYFAKTPLSSSSDEVKLSNALKYKPDFVFPNREQEDLLKSIFSAEINGRTTWWYLTAEMLAFERNLYDGKYINIRRSTAVPYNRLMRILPKITADNIDMQKNSFCSKYETYFSRDFNDTASLIRTAVVRNEDYDTGTLRIIGHLKKMYSLYECDARSNAKNLCLWHINDSKPYDAFPEYSEIRSYLRNSSLDAVGICYSGNAVKYRLEPYARQTIYVCRSLENRSSRAFVTNGHIYRSIDELKRAIETSACFSVAEWYLNDVVPFIRKPAEIKDKCTDVIGWCRKGK